MKKYNKVVLAYSGGLDTSIIIPWLKENYGCEVIAMAADVGQGAELSGLEEKALKTGASNCISKILTDEFVNEYIIPTMQAGAVYEGKYLLGNLLCAPHHRQAPGRDCQKGRRNAIAHGCTGKGNDQVRFELAVKAFCAGNAHHRPLAGMGYQKPR